MKAIVQDVYGAADVLQFKDIDEPVPGDREVLVRVCAAGFDPGVWHLMTGSPYLVRAMGFGLRAPKASVLGSDVAGRVEAVGSKVTGVKPGDEVFGIAAGSFAEYACARDDKIAAKPSNLTFEQAAAVPISAITALQALRDKGRVRPGQRVLLIGAAGGVGTFAVQLAKAFGAEVTGVCSTTKVELVRSIGADHVIDYASDDFADGTRRYDLILAMADEPLSRLRRALTPHGTLVIVGGEGGGRWTGGVERLLGAMLLSPFIGQKLRGIYSRESREDLLALKELIEDGKVSPVVNRTYQLSDAPEAIRDWAANRGRGKVVITV